MRTYIAPKIEIKSFNTENIITTSSAQLAALKTIGKTVNVNYSDTVSYTDLVEFNQ